MKKRTAVLIIAVILTIFISLFALVYNGVIILNQSAAHKYPVKGVDVSAYQGDIDWQTLSEQDISFAFIKATEGSSFVDPKFEYNYSEAAKTGLRIGAYHFFSYDSSGKTQAENFIRNVYPVENMLPPVVDIEFYGDKEKNLPDRETTVRELSVFLTELESFYGIKSIIYATEKSYKLYISDAFSQYDIWIRSVLTRPHLADNRVWTFWQYTNREQLSGYNGNEKYIDMNVFCGTKEDFEKYGKIS